MRLRMPLRIIAKTHFHICNFLACMIFLSSVASLFSKPACAQSAVTATKSGATRSGLSAHGPFDAPGLEQKVNALLQKMTLEEKIGQLVQYSAGQATGPASFDRRAFLINFSARNNAGSRRGMPSRFSPTERADVWCELPGSNPSRQIQ